MEKTVQNFEDLPIYLVAKLLVNLIYKETRTFPKEELYGITSQLRRAAISILLNIAEGQGRKTKKDHKQFLLISRGSTYEVIAILQICLDQQMIALETYNNLRRQIVDVLRQLNGMIKYLEREIEN